jgi:23S rRNA (guanine1835-N2)-methyltransferase
MNTTFDKAGNSLQLYRWPLHQPNTSLQAWDAADELLLQHAQEAINGFNATHGRQPGLLIIHDSFGAVSCALADYPQVQVNDSVLAELGTRYNREQNNLGLDGLTQQSSLAPFPTQVDIVLLKLPNNHSYLQYILQQLAKVVTPDSIILASAKAKDINRNVLGMFEQTLGPAEASLTVKRCRLIRCQFNPQQINATAMTFPLRWPLENTTFTLINHANVFSREKLDQGARFFLQHLPSLLDGQVVIDLGCGNGVLGLPLLNQGKAITMLFCDESYMAVASARETIAENLPHTLSQCHFIVDDCLSQQPDQSADYVLCNPPFHQQQAVTSHIASQMFNDAKRVLKQGGHLRIVANRHLGYAEVLQRLFGNCRQLAADPKFVILEVIKRS